MNIFKCFKKKEPKIIEKSDDFIMFTSDEGMTEEESLAFIYKHLIKKDTNE